MRTLCFKHFAAVVAFSFAAMSAFGATIRVSQELTPGGGDFQFLGTIEAFDAPGQSAADVYGFTLLTASYNGTNPPAVNNTAQSFFVNTTDGLAFFQVLDARFGGGGGAATMAFSVVNDTVGIFQADGPLSAAVGGGGTTVLGIWVWFNCCTDGVTFGPLSAPDWQLLGAFSTTPIGLGNGWRAVSGDSSFIGLAMDPGRRARFEVVPEPGTIALFGTGILGLIAFRRRAAK